MPTRPVENPQRPGMGGSGITNLGDYPGFEGMGDWGAGDWPGTASENPWDIPGSISGDWRGGDWSMNFRPGNVEGAYDTYQDWASGAGEEALPLDRFNDAQYIQAFGSLPDAPGPGADPAGLIGAGYELDFNPGQTANQDWRLQYGISDPAGDPTGWALSGGAPYGGFPWVSGDQSFVRQEEYDAPAQEMELLHRGDSIRDDNTINTDPNQAASENLATQLDDIWMVLQGLIPGEGEDAEAMSSLPYVPPDWERETRVVTGDDPLSESTYSALGALTGQTGGVADTPRARQADQALSQIIQQGGQGAENLSPLGRTTANTLEDLIASGGQLPADTQRRAMEMETLRDPIEAFRQAQLAEGQAAMANRGLLGQGPEIDFMERLESTLAPQYAGAGQQLALSEAERADTRYREALQLSEALSSDQAQRREDRLGDALQRSVGWSEEAARNMVAAATASTDYQRMLGDLALGNLEENRLWNDMLYQAGLDRAKTMETIKQGRLDALLPVIQEYLRAAQTLAGGYNVGMMPEDLAALLGGREVED